MQPATPPAFTARLAAPVFWNSQCLDGACALGSLAADALCAWPSNAEPTACLVPTRFLGGGMGAGTVAWERLAEVVPPHMLIVATMSAAELQGVLVAEQTAAWERCPTAPSAAHGWQVSGVQLAWSSCDDAGGSSGRLLVKQSNGTFVRPRDGAQRLRVLTLAPALPLLGGHAVVSATPAISAQHVVADYLRAHSPFNASAHAAQPRIVHTLATAGCAPSACAAKVGTTMRAARAVGLTDFHAATYHEAAAASARSGALALALLAAGCCGVAWARQRRRHQQPMLQPAMEDEPDAQRAGGGDGLERGAEGGGSRRHHHPAHPPPFREDAGAAASPLPSAAAAMRNSFMPARNDPERQPLRTGSQRLVSSGELAP